MSLPAAKNLARKIYHRSRSNVSKITRSFLSKENPPVLFVFGGRSHHWDGMGKLLYKSEPVFKSSIDKCDEYIKELFGFSLLPNFDGTADEHFFEDELKIIFSLALLQIAQFDLWKSKGVTPDGVLGVSNGELIALYAAGGLSLRDTMHVLKGAAEVFFQNEKRVYQNILVSTSCTEAKQIFKESDVWAEVAHEFSSNTVLAFFHADDKSKVTSLLESKGISWRTYYEGLSWPYHTSKAGLLKQQMHEYISDKQIFPRPISCDFYCSMLGSVIPKNTVIDVDFYFRTLSSTVLFQTAANQLAGTNYGAVIHIGAHPMLKGPIQKVFQQSNKKILNVESMRNDAPELETFQSSLRQIKEVVNTKNDVAETEGSVLATFSSQLNVNAILTSENPYPSYEYLRKNGKIHFLKQHKAWLLLDYEDIDYVINSPQIFSNNVLFEFDRFLLGADPPDHTVMRAALQPLFAPQGSGLDEFIKTSVNQLLDGLADRPQFDFVEEFSLPLVKMVINEFLGLKKEDAEALEKILTGHAYEIRYLKDLEKYFTTYLERIKDEGRPGMGTILLQEVKAGNLPYEGAVSLMKLMWLAGTSTTSILLSNAVYMMLKYPNIEAQIRSNERVIPKFIEECLRIEPPELQIWRLVKQDTELAGQKLPAGSLLMLGLASANRDPRVFNNPDDIILNRPARKHFTFGAGYHYCLGVAMARLEAKISLQGVLERLPNLKMVDENRPLSYYPSNHFRALGKLLVTNKEP
jgi:cytochrome P450